MLELRDITFGYHADRPLYEGVSLSVGSDERVAITAPSGFGKTTLCRIAAGYLVPWSGDVLVDGKPLAARGVRPVQLIMQHPEHALDPRMRMKDSLAEAQSSLDAQGKMGAQRLSDAQQTSRAKRTSEGLGTANYHLEDLFEVFGIRQEWLMRFPHELSGGELQRFCIVRALLTNPRYLIADELSTMLDALTQAQIWHALLRITEEQHMGMMLVSHSPSLTQRIATRVVNLA